MIRSTITQKTVVREIEYQTMPTQQDIIDALLNCEPNEFISIAHNYKMGGMESR